MPTAHAHYCAIARKPKLKLLGRVQAMACLQHLILLLFFSQCNAKSVQQCFRPLPGPEIKHDFYSCSVVMDWSRYATEDCERALGYQVQYINGCTSDYVSLDYTPNETFIFPNKIPGDCSVDTNCYARVRAKFGEAVWSRYSAWTTLSTAYEEVKSNTFKLIILL